MQERKQVFWRGPEQSSLSLLHAHHQAPALHISLEKDDPATANAEMLKPGEFHTQ